MAQTPYFEQRSDHFMLSSQPGFDFPAHLHGQLELLYVRAGQMRVAVGGSQALVPAGGLAVIFPDQVHWYQQAGEASAITMIICGTGYAGGFLDTLTRRHPEEPILPPERLHPDVAYAVGALEQEYACAGAESLVLGPLIQLILGRVTPLLSLRKNTAADAKNLSHRIAAYIHEHCQEPLTLDSVAGEAGISRCYLSRVFPEKMGQNFSAYLASIRLARARALLAETRLPVAEVAAESGFESPRTFYRVFRQHYGMTPMAYRQQGGEAASPPPRQRVEKSK